MNSNMSAPFALPLFPLRTVLFPGMPLVLHIFEERYLQMIQDCLEEQRPFGVVLIKRGDEALGPAAEPHLVGCTAQIAQIEPLNQGRLNILAVGQDRFRIRALRGERPYLVGLVELYPFAPEKPAILAGAAGQLRPFVERYVTVLAEAGEMKLDRDKFPSDPLELAYLAAHLLYVPPLDKQNLLAMEGASDFLRSLRWLYRRELPFLRQMLDPPTADAEGPFSLN
ncbi:MAG: LON peptidase substrate-binding domain-containing protein [Chloroflexota bacterium]